MSLAGVVTKNDSAGEVQQKFTRQTAQSVLVSGLVGTHGYIFLFFFRRLLGNFKRVSSSTREV
jgi:hypothetical protein